MLRTAMLWLSVGLLCIGQAVYANIPGIYDNRFIPLWQRPYIVNVNRRSTLNVDVFFATARQSFGVTDTEIGLPQLYGEYNQAAVGRAFVAIGCPNPLPSRFQQATIAWQQEGKILAQGIELSMQQQIYKNMFVGFYTYVMRVDTVSAFFLNVNSSTGINASEAGERFLLERLRLMMNRDAGLTSGDHAHQIGFGDVDLYLMWQRDWHYCCFLRSIRASAAVGGLLPSGIKRNVNEPTSIPLGGDGFWGMYGAVDLEVELKEDWKLGGFLRASKRFAGTQCERIPLCQVPYPYSPLVATVDVTPGPTFIGSAWVSFEAIHKGLGARLIFTTRRHLADSWRVPQPMQAVTEACDRIKDLTNWGSDYVTLNLLYDFGKIKAEPRGEPILFFAWDVPANMLVTRNVVKTTKITLGIEYNF